MRNTIILLSMLIIAACSNENDKTKQAEDTQKEDSTHKSEKPTEPYADTKIYYNGIDDDAPFVQFYERFNADSAFQLAHINYPLPCIYSDMDGKMDTTTITIDNSTYSNLYKQQGELDKFDLHISHKDGTYIVEQKGIDTGISVTYYFMDVNDEWKLVKIENFST